MTIKERIKKLREEGRISYKKLAELAELNYASFREAMMEKNMRARFRLETEEKLEEIVRELEEEELV